MDARRKVLVVDDDPQVRRVLARIIKRFGLTVDAAGDGLAALDRIAATRYDLVVSDVRMPNMDGVELLRQTRHRGHAIGAFVFLTGHGSRDAGELMALGAGAVYGKPLNGRQIEEMVNAWAGPAA
ncbi:MAG: response regulator [Myxococcales bacterium]|nr:response regulator [Myxococcales bacterium]